MDPLLRDLCAWARARSPFYARYHHAVESREDFERLPALTPEQFRQEDLLTGPARGAVAFASSGSEGRPKVVYREYSEQHRVAAGLARGLASVLTAEDRVANLLVPGLWAAHFGMNQAIERLGALLIPIGGHLPAREMARLLGSFRATAAVGLPGALTALEGVTLARVVSVGEPLYPATRERLAQQLAAPVVAAPVYAAVEAGALGYQCPRCLGTRAYHVLEDQVKVELVDQAVLVTCLHRRLQPLIRYRLGDRAVWREAECGRQLELLGRGDEVLIIGGSNIHAAVVERVLEIFPGLGPRFQMRARTLDGQDQLSLMVEGKGDPEAVRRALLAHDPQLGLMARDARMAPLEVELVEELPGKLGRVRDERQVRPA